MKKQNCKKVMVGLSGGVDSCVTAYLLQQDGYEVQSVYMKLHNMIDGYHEKNIKNIKNISKFLNIPYHILDLTQQFKVNVYDYFINSYIDGVTPNPCIMCNKTIKFGAMFDFAIKNNCDYLATGHYAKTDGNFIYEADDKSKDQSYFLGQIKQQVLSKLIFPMSTYNKTDIRKIALNIPAFQNIATQKDSQEICFVQHEYTDILQHHTNIELKGNTLDVDGNIIGDHKGYMHYTIGKRKGFYVHGAHEPHFVKNIDPSKNTITVCNKEQLKINQVIINNLNMFIDNIKFIASVKLRYKSTAVSCRVTISNDKKNATITLYAPVFGVACGQIAVFYNSNKVIGSGVIISTNHL
ncbi:tRNA-specific 2-thiouridylase MnmA [hydrothermal vent metagenome]|uniref:tRNA-specific 2-thiouridylase MnmA n=1 Tax=hydrothermal vent metagenome TaxID=652676 RepID=A0A3B1E574_9ZZZZ